MWIWESLGGLLLAPFFGWFPTLLPRSPVFLVCFGVRGRGIFWTPPEPPFLMFNRSHLHVLQKARGRFSFDFMSIYVDFGSILGSRFGTEIHLNSLPAPLGASLGPSGVHMPEAQIIHAPP